MGAVMLVNLYITLWHLTSGTRATSKAQSAKVSGMDDVTQWHSLSNSHLNSFLPCTSQEACNSGTKGIIHSPLNQHVLLWQMQGSY
jgi:hypothetical protein